MIEFLNMDKISSNDIVKTFYLKNDNKEDRTINILSGDGCVKISINIHRYMTNEDGFRVDTGIMDHIIVAKAESINGGLCITRYADACRKDDSKFKRLSIIDFILYGKSKEAVQMINVIENNL